MKKTLFLIMHLLVVSSCLDVVHSAQSAMPAGAPMISILSWNILGPRTGDVSDYFDPTIDRLPGILQIIQNSRPDIICLQEIDKISEAFFDKNLKGYQKVAYAAKGANGGVVLYVKINAKDRTQDKYTIITQGSYALPGGGAAVSVLLASKKTGSQFLISSVHISRSSSISAAASGQAQFAKLQNELNNLVPNQMGVYKIFAGDFNTQAVEVQSVTMRDLAQDGKIYAEAFPGAETSFHKSGNYFSIDHIVYSQPLQLVLQHNGNILSKLLADMRPFSPTTHLSDHAPLYAVFVDAVSGTVSATAMPVVHHPKTTAKSSAPQAARVVGGLSNVDVLLRELQAYLESEKVEREILSVLKTASRYPQNRDEALAFFDWIPKHLKDLILSNEKADSMFGTKIGKWIQKIDDLKLLQAPIVTRSSVSSADKLARIVLVVKYLSEVIENRLLESTF